MTLNMDAVGELIGPVRRDYTWKDVVLYALGVGAGFSELDYCFEKTLKVIPSFSIAAIFDFLSQATLRSGVNLAGILHGEQELIFHHPIPPQGTLTTTGKIDEYRDKGKDKGALIRLLSETTHNDGRTLFTSMATIFARLDGGFGGNDRRDPSFDFPEREPDLTVDDAPSPDQPLLYRLSGDVFHLHVDPAFARLAGFERPIMHGLCTHGFACRALIGALVPGQPEKARRLSCRFTRPLYPGIPIRTLIWKSGGGKALWRTINAESGAVVIDRGEFDYGDVPSDRDRIEDLPTAIGNGRSDAGFSSVPAIFEAMPDAFVPEAAVGVEAIFQFDIGDAGRWHCTIENGRCRVEAGRHTSPTVAIEMSANDFLEMINGRLAPVTALTEGRLKIEGDVMKATLIETLFRLH